MDLRDDEDPIVREIDVYINRLEDQKCDFYLLQYPLRPAYRPYGDHGQLNRIRRRPETKRLELTYALNVNGPQFNPSAKALVDSFRSMEEEGKLSPSAKVELEALLQHKMQSVAARADEGCEYGLAFMRKGRLYIVPASRLLQFRPDFSHQDELAAMHKARAQAATATMDGGAGGAGAVAAAGANDGSTALMAERGLQARLKLTHAQQKAKEDNEAYEEIQDFFEPDTPQAAEITKQLASFPIQYVVETQQNDDDFEMFMDQSQATPTERGPGGGSVKKREVRMRREEVSDKIPQIFCDESFEKYLNALCAGCSTSELAGTRTSTSQDTSAGLGSGPLSYLSLSRLSTEEQVRSIMKHCEIETFANIKRFLTNRNATDGDITEMLCKPEVASLVNGTWVASSDLIYEQANDRYTEIEKLTRTLLIQTCAMGQHLSVAKLVEPGKVPMEVAARVWSRLYHVKAGKFIPKAVPDESFQALFPTLCEEALKKHREGVPKTFDALQRLCIAEAQRAAQMRQGVKQRGELMNGIL